VKRTGVTGKGKDTPSTARARRRQQLDDELARVARALREEVVSACAAKVGEQDAEDAAHEGFVRVLEPPGSLAIEPRVGVVRVAGGIVERLPLGLEGEWRTRARKECEREKRGRWRERRFELAGLTEARSGANADPEAIAIARSSAAGLMAGLTDEQRHAVWLRLEGLELPEIGARMGVGRTKASEWVAGAKAHAAAYLREQAERLRDLGALVAAPLARLRLQLRRRVAALADDGQPAGWAARQVASLPQYVAAVAGVGVVALVTVVNVPAMSNAGTIGQRVGLHASGRTASRVVAPRGDAGPAPSATATSGGIATEARRSGVTATVAGVAGRALPSAETPADTYLIAAAGAADFTVSHAMVGVGFGQSCQCTVLFSTRDAGRTWDSAQAAPAAEQVVLPSGFPERDHRVFVGTAPSSGVAPYVVDTAAGTLTPLPVAGGGHVALSAGFGDGDPRVFVTGTAAMWSVDTATMQSRVELLDAGTPTAALVATAPGSDDGAAVYVAIPSGAAALPPGLYMCPTVADAGCTLRSDPAVPGMTSLATTTVSGRGAVIAVWDGSVHLSWDGGRSFVGAGAPQAGLHINAVSAADGEVWAQASRTGVARHDVVMLDVSSGEWRDLGDVNGGLSVQVVVVAITGRVVLDAAPVGVLCTSDAGASWLSHC